MARNGFVLRSTGGWWNVVVQDESTREHFLLEQSITALADAVHILQRDRITPVYAPLVEEWMRADSSQEDADDEMRPDTDDTVTIPGDILAEYHGLDGSDQYSDYYHHLS